MKYLINSLKLFVYLILFLIFTLIGLRFTLDLNALKPEIEQQVSTLSGGQFKLSEVKLGGALGLRIPSAELTFPLTPEQETEWDRFRAYLKDRRQAKEAGRPEPEPLKAPAPAMKLCTQSMYIDLSLSTVFSLVLGGDISAEVETLLFECGLPNGALTEIEPRRLSLSLKTLWDGLGTPRRAQELSLKFKLNELDLGENELIRASSPIEVAGILVAEGEGVVNIGRLGRLQLKKSAGQLNLSIKALKTKAATISALELPPVSFGEVIAKLEFERGDLQVTELTTRSSDIQGDVTGHIRIFGGWIRSKLNVHIALDLSSEFIRKNPDVKTIATLQRRYFTLKGDGGYDVGVLIKGTVGRPRVTASRNSPYSKEGRKLSRQKKRDRAREKRSNNRPGARKSSKKRTPQAKRRRDRNKRRKNKSKRQKRRSKRRASKSKPITTKKTLNLDEIETSETEDSLEDDEELSAGEGEDGEDESDGEDENDGEGERESEREEETGEETGEEREGDQEAEE